MKKNALFFPLALICLLLIAHSSKAQTLWGTLPDAFLNITPAGDYNEAFKDGFIGSYPGTKIFISPDNTLYGEADNQTIYRYRPGDLRPSVVFRQDPGSLSVSYIDFENNHIYGGLTTGGSSVIFRLNLDGTNYVVLRGNDGNGAYGGLIPDGNKIFGLRPNGVFSMDKDGSNYQLIRTTTGPAERITKLAVRSENVLWGLSQEGGSCGRGALFELAKDGSTLYKIIEFRGADNCGHPEEDPGEPGFEVVRSSEPVGLLKDNQDDDWFIITQGNPEVDGDFGKLVMYGADGLWDLHTFGYGTARPNGTLVFNPAGQLFGLCGVIDDLGGKIFKYDSQNEVFSIAFDFDHHAIGSLVTTFGLGSDGRFYGFAERTTFNYIQTPSIFSLNQDGTDGVQLANFKSAFGPRDIAYGENTLVGIFASSTTNEEGGPHGTVFTYTSSGVNTIYDYGESAGPEQADSSILSIGGGNAYVLAAPYNFMARAKLDGTSSLTTNLPDFRTSAPLTTTSAGLFGTSFYDASHAYGFIFKVNTDFGGITPIYSFSSSTGSKPHGKVVEGTDGFLYGTTLAGGSSNNGVVFKVRPNGTDYSVLHHFGGADGALPYGGLLVDGSDLFGLTSSGGANNKGTLFKITNGGTFTKLFDFDGTHGSNPKGDLTIDGDGYLYGITSVGGTDNDGVIFQTDKSGNLVVLKNLDRKPIKEHLAFASNAIGEKSYLISPADASTGVSGSPELSLHPVKYAVLYTVELSTTPDFSGTIIAKTINGTIGQIEGLSYSTTYYARVKTDASTGYGAITSFTTGSHSGDAFVISPADSALYVPATNVAVTANEVTGASSYTIELNTSSDFTGTSLVQTSPSAGERTLIFASLSYFTKYYSRVKTDLNPAWGPTRSFTTIGQETYVIDPADNETGVHYSRQIKIHPIPGVTTYILKLDHTTDGSPGNTQVVDSTEPIINFSGLAYSSTYTASVRTNANPNYGPTTTFYTVSSDVDSYVVTPANGAVNVPTNVVVYSNIVGEAAHYTIELNTSSDFTGTSIVKSSPEPYIWYLTFTGLAPGTTYYSRVKTELSPNWGATRSFTTAATSGVYVIDPTDNKVDVSVTPLVKITPQAGATLYTLQISESSTFTTGVTTLTSSEPNIRSTPLKYVKLYYTRAKTNLSGAYSLVTRFTTHDAYKYAFVSNPVDGATGVATNNLKVTANIVYGATSYRIELNTSPDFTGTSIVRTSASSGQRTLTFNGLAPGTTYYSRVNTDVSGVYGPVRSFTTGVQPIYVIDPYNGKTEVSPNVVIRVQTVPAASQYTLQLSKTSDFASPTTVISLSPQFISTLGYSTTWYTRAKTNLSDYGPVTSFTTHAPEKFSFVSSPANGATNVGMTNVPITANQVIGATIYTIELNTSSDFTGTSIVRSSAVPNQRTIIFPSLAPGTTYYNRTSTNLPSDWGPVRSFTTAFGVAPVEVAENPTVKVYPNPFSDSFTVETGEVTNDQGVIVLTDITGKQLKSLDIKSYETLRIGEELPQGFYILQFRDAKKQSTHRLTKK